MSEESNAAFLSELRPAMAYCGYTPDGLAAALDRDRTFVERLLGGHFADDEIDEPLIDDLARVLQPSGSQRPSDRPDARAARLFDTLGMGQEAMARRARLVD